MSMASKFCLLIFCLLDNITSCIHATVCAQATHQIWTNGYRAHHRLRAYALWLHTCIPQVMWIHPSRGCLSCEQSFPPLAYKAPASWWSLKTAGKWQKCNLVSGKASVVSDMGWLWTGWICPAPVQMSRMLSVLCAVMIVCGLFRVLSSFPLTLSLLREQSTWSFLGLDSCVLAYCISASPLFSSNLSTTTQGAIVKLCELQTGLRYVGKRGWGMEGY